MFIRHRLPQKPGGLPPRPERGCRGRGKRRAGCRENRGSQHRTGRRRDGDQQSARGRNLRQPAGNRRCGREGIQFVHLLQALKLEEDGVKCVAVRAEKTESGTVYEEDFSRTQKIPADSIIVAIGQGRRAR